MADERERPALYIPPERGGYRAMFAAELIGRCDQALENADWDIDAREDWLMEAINSPTASAFRDLIGETFEIVDGEMFDVIAAVRGLAVVATATGLDSLASAERIRMLDDD